MSVFVYHHDDLDGRCSAAIVKLKHQDAKFQESHYDRSPVGEHNKNDRIYVVDFSFEPKEFRRLLNMTQNVIWIDHHATAIESAERCGLDSLDGLRSAEKPSAAMLTWKFLFGDKEPPIVVDLVDRWDTWVHDRDPKIIDFVNGSEVEDTNPCSGFWGKLVGNDYEYLESVRQKGRVIQSYKNQRNIKIIEDMGVPVKFEGLNALCCNLPMCNSMDFKSQDGKYDIYMPFYLTPRGFTVSLYQARDGLEANLGEIASKYGGGGHRGAAGFQCKSLPFWGE